MTTDGAYVTVFLSAVMQKMTDAELGESIAHHQQMLTFLYAEQERRAVVATLPVQEQGESA